MPVGNSQYDGKYHHPAIEIEQGLDAENQVILWPQGDGGITFTLEQWKFFIISEYRNLGLDWK